jgi:BolA protein
MSTHAQAPSQAVTALDIDAALRSAFSPTRLLVEDESHHHAGHVGAAEGSHFRVTIVSSSFAGVSRVGRHRLVYDALSGLIPRGIHALAIVAEAE